MGLPALILRKCYMDRKRIKMSGDRDRDLIRRQWPQLSPAEKLKYIISYYGVAIVIVIIAVAVTVFLVRDIRGNKVEDAFYVMVIDKELTEDEVSGLEEELAGLLGLDPQTQQCVVEAGYSGTANMQSEATISTYMQSGRVDLAIAPEEDFNRYATAGWISSMEDLGLSDLENDYAIEDLFYATLVDYSQGGAVTELPYHPHEITEDSGCYGIYLRGGVFDGYVIGAMSNSENGEYIQAGMRYFLELAGQ